MFYRITKYSCSELDMTKTVDLYTHKREWPYICIKISIFVMYTNILTFKKHDSRKAKVCEVHKVDVLFRVS